MKIMFHSKLYVFFVLLNIVCGSYGILFSKQKVSQLSKQRFPDYDNRYVWFTREVRDKIKNKEYNQEEFRMKHLNTMFSRKDKF
jgi:hypothetical protein